MSGDAVGLATGYVKLWPREVFYIKQGEQVKDRLNGAGVYILFQDTKVFYVGQSKSLFRRLRRQARKPFTLWNHFQPFWFQKVIWMTLKLSSLQPRRAQPTVRLVRRSSKSISHRVFGRCSYSDGRLIRRI